MLLWDQVAHTCQAKCAGKDVRVRTPGKGFATRASRALGGIQGLIGSKGRCNGTYQTCRCLGSMLAVSFSVVPSCSAKRKGLTLSTRISPDEGYSSDNATISSANTSTGTLQGKSLSCHYGCAAWPGVALASHRQGPSQSSKPAALTSLRPHSTRAGMV